MPDANEVPWSLTLSEIGRRLELLREREDLTLAAVAHALRDRGIKTDASALSRIESGKRRRVSPDLVKALLDCYHTDAKARRDVLGLLSADSASPRRLRRPALWRRHAALLGPMRFEGYLKLEPRALVLRNYEPALAPGLLQTPEYARHAIASMRPELKPAEIDGLVDVRMNRQRAVEDGQLRELQALIEQDALRRIVGDRAVMREQLEHLLAISRQAGRSIRVLPNTIGSHPGLAGPFMLMDFPKLARSVVWLETMTRSVCLDEADDVDRYAEVFADLWGRALTQAATRAFVRSVIKELSE